MSYLVFIPISCTGTIHFLERATHKGNEPRYENETFLNPRGIGQSGVSTDTWWASMSPPEGSNFAFRESDERIVVFMKKLENNKK
ncbi:hypothetical protein CsSME_00023816 [Camellia sinensis var. sinensis]